MKISNPLEFVILIQSYQYTPIYPNTTLTRYNDIKSAVDIIYIFPNVQMAIRALKGLGDILGTKVLVFFITNRA